MHIGLRVLIFLIGMAGAQCQGGQQMNEVEENLVKIREVAIAYLEQEKPLNWSTHGTELRRGAILNLEGTHRIGRWIFDSETLTLLREADLASEVRSYGLIFEQRDGGNFTVLRDFWESESFDID